MAFAFPLFCFGANSFIVISNVVRNLMAVADMVVMGRQVSLELKAFPLGGRGTA